MKRQKEIVIKQRKPKKNRELEYTGLYVAPKAATFLTATLCRDIPSPIQKIPINSRNLIRWVRVGLMSPELRKVRGHDLIISFEDLISMRVIAALRSFGLSWPDIHRAEKWLRDTTGYRRPFAVEQVWTDMASIFTKLDKDLFVAVSRSGQLALSELLGEYLQPVGDMTFNPHNGVNVAATWTPHMNVLLDPLIQFGEPCIKGTRIRTRIVSQMACGGDSFSYIERALSLTVEQVTHALEWEDRLKTKVAS